MLPPRWIQKTAKQSNAGNDISFSCFNQKHSAASRADFVASRKDGKTSSPHARIFRMQIKKRHRSPKSCDAAFRVCRHRRCALLSERQIVGSAFFGCRCRSGGIGRCAGNGSRCDRSTISRCTGRSAFHFPSTNRVEPASVVFASVNVEAHGHLLAHLNIEFAQTIFAKHIKHTATGILFVGFNNKRLRFPFVAGAGGCAAAEFESMRDFSCNFHLIVNLSLRAKVRLFFQNRAKGFAKFDFGNEKPHLWAWHKVRISLKKRFLGKPRHPASTFPVIVPDLYLYVPPTLMSLDFLPDEVTFTVPPSSVKSWSALMPRVLDSSISPG